MNTRKMKVLAIVLCLGFVFTACSSSKDKLQETKEEEVKESKKEVYALGEVAVGEDQSLRIVEVQHSEGEMYDVPDEGKEFIIVTVEIKNTSDKEISYNPLNFKMQNSQGQIENETFTTVASDTSLGYGKLANGGTVSGTIVFEQPINDPDLTLILETSLWSGEELKIKLQ